jgi:hypothetical protein
LPPFDRLLIVLHSRADLTYEQVRENLRQNHPQIYLEHQKELEKNTAYCWEKAKEKLEKVAHKIFDVLWVADPNWERCNDFLGE